MTLEHYQENMSMTHELDKIQGIKGKPVYEKAQWFLTELYMRGMLPYLVTNDWTSSYPFRIYIETPYPNHKIKEYQRFDSWTLKQAVKWLEKWEELNDKGTK